MNTLARILVVEDDPTIRTLLGMMLRGAGYRRVKSASRGDEGLAMVRAEKPDLVLLDLMLPGLDGLTVCSRIKAEPELADVRIIMLTAKTEDSDVVRGLELGADDYVCKPFSREVLVARIGAALRRAEGGAAGKELDGLRVDAAGACAFLGGEALTLTKGEFRLLSLLVSRPGRVYTRAKIIEACQDEERSVTERTVDVMMVGLRKKLGEWSAHVETIRGVGYRVKP